MNDQSFDSFPGGLEGKGGVVTAAAVVIGGATALRLARDGAEAVVAIDTSADVKQMEEDINAIGSKGLGIELDCTKESGVVSAFADVIRRFGRIDILVNGVGGGGGFREVVHSETLCRAVVAAL